MNFDLSPAARFDERARQLTPAERWAERIRTLLTTRPGTLPWRPKFGMDLEWLVGQPLNSVNLNLLRWRLRSTLAEFLPGLTIRRLTLSVVSDFAGARELRDRAVPLAESALLPYGAGGRVDVQLDVVTPDGPVDLGLNLKE